MARNKHERPLAILKQSEQKALFIHILDSQKWKHVLLLFLCCGMLIS